MEGQTDNGMVRDNDGMEKWGESHYFLSFIDEKKEHESQKQINKNRTTERQKSLQPCQRHMFPSITTSSYEHQETHTHALLVFGGLLRLSLIL